MPAPKGHPLWGSPLNIKKYTPDEFWNKFLEYKEWADKNPLMIIEQTKMPQRIPSNYDRLKHGSIKGFLKQTIPLPHPRAYSIEAFCAFANINRSTFYNYESKDGYETYFNTSKRIKDIIDSQHFEGGMAGVFNSNLAARKLGLVDKKDMTSGGAPMKLNITVQDQNTIKELEKLKDK